MKKKYVYVISTCTEKRERFGLVTNVHTYIEKLNHFFLFSIIKSDFSSFSGYI